MKTLKLVIGIMCCVLCVMVLFQSCAAGLANALEDNGESSGFAGMLVALFMLAGGIIMIATRNSNKKGGSIAAAVIFIFAALIGFGNKGSFADLGIWSSLCLINGGINLLPLFGKKKKTQDAEAKS